jgi:hypothetical protein
MYLTSNKSAYNPRFWRIAPSFALMRFAKACFLVSFAVRNVLSAPSNRGFSVSIDLSSYFNNKGVSASPGGANFDSNSGSYPLNQLPMGVLSYRGINVSFCVQTFMWQIIDEGAFNLVYTSTMGLLVTGQCSCARAEHKFDSWTISFAPSVGCR